jgi:hypothetical protein
MEMATAPSWREGTNWLAAALLLFASIAAYWLDAKLPVNVIRNPMVEARPAL